MFALLFAVALATDSTVYPVLNHDRPVGSMVVVRHGDSVTVRWIFTDRNRGTRLETRYVLRDGRIVFSENRPILADDRSGEPTSRLELVGDSIRRWTPARTTTEAYHADAYYGSTFTPFEEAALARFLLRRPDHTTKLPGPTSPAMRLDVVKETSIQTSHGKERARLVALYRGTTDTPEMVWLDGNDDLLATEVGWFITVKPGAETALPALRKIETEFRDAKAEAMNRRLVKTTSGTIAIVHGDVFDSERGAMRPRTTVVVRGDRIVAVGPDDSVSVPAGATVIDAAGKTVMPGLWEMHNHMQLFSESLGSPMQLSYGITTARDLASDIDVATSQRDRAERGLIAAPHTILAGFMEGPGKWAGPTATIIRTEDEARRWVAAYDSMGYKQIKVYNLVHPDLIPTIVAEAHRRGMRVSGHIPRGLSVPAAIELGFDEVNHAAFLFSTFYQDSLYMPTMRAYSLVATTVAPNIDVDGAPMTALIADLKRHNTVIDGTFSVWVIGAGTGVAQGVGAGLPSNVQKADSNYMRLLRRLYDGGVTLVAGTDAFGSSSYNTELELYEKAGIPSPAVLQIATIGSARVMKEDRDYGSLSVGKVADIIVVGGKPAEHVADLREVEQVLRAGRWYDVRDLKVATSLVVPN
jgi:imidazolonepropionase-like amidohydrolase